jgi:hypothetical protein
MGWTANSYAFWISAESAWILAESAVDQFCFVVNAPLVDIPTAGCFPAPQARTSCCISREVGSTPDAFRHLS